MPSVSNGFTFQWSKVQAHNVLGLSACGFGQYEKVR
jgi:hypothetical protein